MEQALYITKTSHLHYWKDVFQRLYFGVEFCERLIPSSLQLTKALDFALKHELGFTLVTPYVTERGLSKIEELLNCLAASGIYGEIVFNDWGTFHLLKETGYQLKPVLGRLLNKMKRGPRILPIRDRIPATSLHYFTTPGASIPAIQRFLIKHGITRVEFDNLLQGIHLSGIAADLHRSLYLPFAYITTTRFCPMASANFPEDFTLGILPCRKECRHYAFSLLNPVMTTPLIRKGNTVFFSNEAVPQEQIHSNKIDRIVVQPEIPL